GLPPACRPGAGGRQGHLPAEGSGMPGFPRTTCVASIALLLLVACAAAPGEPDAGGVTVSVDGTTLVYRGPLHRQGVAALRQAAAGAPETPRALVITSTGGDVEAG